MTSKVYIVLLNYNGFLDTMECLESVLKLEYDNFQIIVIENSETQGPFEKLIDWALGKFDVTETNFKNHVFPLEQKPLDFSTTTENELLNKELEGKVVFVKANSNNGFAAGNNVALKYILKFGSKDDYIWLLNNDTIVEKSALVSIMSEIDSNKEVDKKFIYGTPLLEYYDPNIVQVIGGVYNKRTGMTWHFGEGKTIDACRSEFEERNKIIDYPAGASMLIKLTFLQEIGLLCEDYFLFYEELDWAYRAKLVGGDIRILDCFCVYHKQGNTTKTKKKEKKSEFIDLLSIKNRIIFARKFNKKNLNLVRLSILTLTIGKRVLQGNFKIIPKVIHLIITT